MKSYLYPVTIFAIGLIVGAFLMQNFGSASDQRRFDSSAFETQPQDTGTTDVTQKSQAPNPMWYRDETPTKPPAPMPDQRPASSHASNCSDTCLSRLRQSLLNGSQLSVDDRRQLSHYSYELAMLISQYPEDVSTLQRKFETVSDPFNAEIYLEIASQLPQEIAVKLSENLLASPYTETRVYGLELMGYHRADDPYALARDIRTFITLEKDSKMLAHALSMISNLPQENIDNRIIDTANSLMRNHPDPNVRAAALSALIQTGEDTTKLQQQILSELDQSNAEAKSRQLDNLEYMMLTKDDLDDFNFNSVLKDKIEDIASDTALDLSTRMKALSVLQAYQNQTN